MCFFIIASERKKTTLETWILLQRFVQHLHKCRWSGGYFSGGPCDRINGLHVHSMCSKTLPVLQKLVDNRNQRNSVLWLKTGNLKNSRSRLWMAASLRNGELADGVWALAAQSVYCNILAVVTLETQALLIISILWFSPELSYQRRPPPPQSLSVPSDVLKGSTECTAAL